MNTKRDERPNRVLVVDDNRLAREALVDVLRDMGHEVKDCENATEALRVAGKKNFDLIITDLMMPGMDGIEFLHRLQTQGSQTQSVMVTAHGSIETAVQAMRFGAYDYVEKPYSVEQIEAVVARALEHGSKQGLRSRVIDPEQVPMMIGDSAVMRNLRELIQVHATHERTVLIQGESGTGKELVAQSIHTLSARRNATLVSVNCPALSPQLIESELFGHEKGAFTNADTPRIGRFELANAGTLFLDEITELELGMQSKLLRVLQERKFERVGSSVTQSLDVRVIAATNRDLRSYVREKSFREDLYYRLAVMVIEVPALRERREDIPLLVNHFMELNRTQENSSCEFSDSAMNLLVEYAWPGNVRELKNIIDRASIVMRDRVATAEQLRPWLGMGPLSSAGNDSDRAGELSSTRNQHDFPLGDCRATSERPAESNKVSLSRLGKTILDLEREHIELTLKEYGGHREKTARALGISVRTLSNKLRSYGYGQGKGSFEEGDQRAA